LTKKYQKISFIQPSRNNLKYLKWSYESIRKNLGYEHEICIADDASTDGTSEWVLAQMKRDKNLQLHINKGPERLGHTILYDVLINEYATNDVVMIWHADMYACPRLDEEVLRHIEPGVVVSGTRIEPPLHPQGPEKILKDFGIEPEEFDERGLIEFLNTEVMNQYGVGITTEGIFAPWAILKSDWDYIGGHDPLFAPQSKEDSDIFNRFHLAGYKFKQTWGGFVYHMTCRGSRFADGAKRNPDGQVFMKNRETDEWLKQNYKSTREFIRKWGHMVKHDSKMKPIVPPKYDIGFIVNNCSPDLLRELEPWCSNIFVDCDFNHYIKSEKTSFDLNQKIKVISEKPTNDIVVEFDCRLLTNNNFQYLAQLSEILKDSGQVGTMELDIFKLSINKLNTYEKELIQL
jgi:glycosyltransferase involved in cell wall biosynthesis